MNEQNFSTLQHVVTPEIVVEIHKKGSFFAGAGKYMDADDELLEIAKWIQKNVEHNSDIKPERIKFLYTTNVKKDGGRYVIGGLELISEIEKMIDDNYDYVIFVHYKSWKELDIENKVINLDKILCGINIDNIESKNKKYSVDVKEYRSNLSWYGTQKVLNSSEMIDMTIERIIDEEKEERKSKDNK